MVIEDHKVLDGLRRFKVRVAWARRRSQRCSGKSGSQLVMLEIRWSLKVWIACSAELFGAGGGGGYKLKSYSHAAHIIFEASWTFVFKYLELGAKAPIGELRMEDGVGSDELCFTS